MITTRIGLHKTSTYRLLSHFVRIYNKPFNPFTLTKHTFTQNLSTIVLFKSNKRYFSHSIQPTMQNENEENTTKQTANTQPEINPENTPNDAPPGYMCISEGSAKVLYKKQIEVFYNPVQEYNRDLSIAVISDYILSQSQENRKRKGPIRILEALAATGLRSIRYAKELPDPKVIISNDIDQNAVDSIKLNAEYNKIPAEIIIPNQGDASMVMYQNRTPDKQFDVIDIDPYGSPSMFLDSAVQAVVDGGLLCVTATDMAILCGSHAESSWNKYNSIALKGQYCHEAGLRTLLSFIEAQATKYKRYIVPVLTLSIDFYARVFVRVYTSALESKKSASRLSSIYQCIGCETFNLQPLLKVATKDKSIKYNASTLNFSSTNCPHCNKTFRVGGPLWNAPIHSPEVIQRILTRVTEKPSLFNTSKRIIGMLTLANEELQNQPLYYNVSSLCNVLHVTSPSLAVIKSAMITAGFKVSEAHAKPGSIKTDAPPEVLWDIMRCWAKLHPPKQPLPTSPAHFILSKEPTIQADFTLREDLKTSNVARFLPNPSENWGPLTKAGKRGNEILVENDKNEGGQGSSSGGTVVVTPNMFNQNADRREKNQGKNGKKPKRSRVCKAFLNGDCRKKNCADLHELPPDFVMFGTENENNQNNNNNTDPNVTNSEKGKEKEKEKEKEEKKQRV
eukprot:TRINITY_DN2633_c0_g1_i4.p1 TRINITY_DN2633_c0_g1~~TRINITY_DN2633_c0_g1_i4.p1  ORF type:complete len:677 (+),score=149.49 TRINITY_DN2633_c0_g1_i4:1310-3340(+)